MYLKLKNFQSSKINHPKPPEAIFLKISLQNTSEWLSETNLECYIPLNIAGGAIFWKVGLQKI